MKTRRPGCDDLDSPSTERSAAASLIARSSGCLARALAREIAQRAQCASKQLDPHVPELADRECPERRSLGLFVWSVAPSPAQLHSVQPTRLPPLPSMKPISRALEISGLRFAQPEPLLGFSRLGKGRPGPDTGTSHV